MNKTISHPEVNVFRGKGGLFDVSNSEMEKNIGRQVKFIKPTCMTENEVFTITELQKDYRGKTIYRGMCPSDVHKFGRPIYPNEVVFVN